jgi:hypothetical protein
MDETTFLKDLGLRGNPFQYTNADEEDNLPDYFVPPPYFPSVWGNPKKPSSCVVFAPRGGGKSAQRKMIEIKSRDSGVLALQYSRFEFEGGQTLKHINLDYHLRNVIRLCLVGLLMAIYEKNLDHLSFETTERQHIRALARFYLNDMNPDELVSAANSIMSPLDKAKAFFEKNLWLVNNILDSLLAKVGVGSVGASDRASEMKRPSKNHLEIAVSLITSLGFDSIYILVDKVDETEFTGNDASASFDLLAPMLRDLDLLQMSNIGFKFFLWNEIFPFYKRRARPDRVNQYDLKWDRQALSKMMELRLKAFAANHDGRFFDLFRPPFFGLFDPSVDDSVKRGVEDLVLTFCHGSPRDMIRICQQMVSEQLRLAPEARGIGLEGVTEGFNVFCNERAVEVVPDNIMSELRKTHRLNFTVNYVANDVFKIRTNSARSKIKTWVKTGVVKRIDDVKVDTFSKPLHHYAVTDSRVAKCIFKELDFIEFLQTKVRNCSKCGHAALRDWDLAEDHTCDECGTSFK